MPIRHIATAAVMLVSGALIGVTTQQLVAADVSTGDRPVLISIEPCRIADTRPASQVGPRSSPLGPADTHTIDAQELETDCTGKIPADALALSLNVTALRATQQTFLTIWAGGTRPEASSLNPAPGQPPVPNAVTTELSIDQEFEVFNNRGSVHVIIDVNGYYVDHNHDDRYRPVMSFTRRPPTFATTYPFSSRPTVSFDLPSSGTLSITAAIFTTVSAGARATCNIGQTAPAVITDLTNRSSVDGTGTHSLVGAVDVAGPGAVDLEIRCVRGGDPDNGTINDYQLNAIFVPD